MSLPNQTSVNFDDVVSVLKSGNQISSGILAALEALGPFLESVLGASIHVGSFTCSAASATTVANTATAANSAIIPIATNAAAGTLMGSSRSLYLSARTVGTSFQFTTASGVAAGGTETFIYVMINPVS